MTRNQLPQLDTQSPFYFNATHRGADRQQTVSKELEIQYSTFTSAIHCSNIYLSRLVGNIWVLKSIGLMLYSDESLQKELTASLSK